MNISDKLNGLKRENKFLFNRCICVLAMAQFRRGHFSACFELINKLMSCTNPDGRPVFKELIGQSNSDPMVNKMSPFEYRKTLVPYHMHINTDLLRYTYFMCCLLGEYQLLAEDKEYYNKHFNKVNSEFFASSYLN